jgi:hypothetical protein
MSKVNEMKQASPELRNSLIEAIKFQLEENNPPETKQAFIRLLGQGISEQDAYIYLAQALTYEMFAMMKEKRTHDRDNYAKLLANLPNLN